MKLIARFAVESPTLAFLDFEASSLAKRSYPIEVAWIFEDGRSESYLIRPAPDWTDWDPAAEAIHHIGRDLLLRDGSDHGLVAARMIAELSGHDLLASAPSWDGKWMSALLRAAGLPRHSLRLRKSDEALREVAVAVLAPVVPSPDLDAAVAKILGSGLPCDHGLAAHRALPDAEAERARWLAVREAAERVADAWRTSG
ncbi:transcriptional regulator [Sphingomonas sp. MMS12-HWE2-04]|uniref:3'-5' exonuclease n=1 Tax=Sphingomonas sp. MMS12-HWE2-04 TaxID=3234199 RepID=UPI00384B608E